MNALELWIHSPGARALGWTLFHFLWEGTVIAGLLAGALAAMKPGAARARYGAACAALAAMALAFGTTLVLEWPWGAARLTMVPALPGAALTGAVFGDAARGAGLRWSAILEWAPALWLAGVFGLYLYRLGSWIAALRLRRMGACAAPVEWQHRLRDLARTMGVGRTALLLESCLAEVPILIGYLKPAIVMPIGLLAGLPPEQVEAILLHELAHIRRADYLVNLLQTAIEGLLFYHPAVWWVSGAIRAERENCCDDRVVELRGDPGAYAEALFLVEKQRTRLPETALAATGGSLARRVRRLLGKPDPRDLMLPVLPSALLLVSLAVALAAWQPARRERAAQPAIPAVETVAAEASPAAARAAAASQPAEPATPAEAAPTAARPEPAKPASPVAEQEPQQPAPAAVESNQTPAAFEQWLVDTLYLRTTEETSAFRRLQTDEERAYFIEQFWARRNPAGTPANTFRDEYYRRLAYAQEHFSRPAGGFNTLGRTYLRYGPPDEIEDHPAGVPVPTQSWRYHYLDAYKGAAEFEFVKAGDDYRRQIQWPPPSATFTGQGAAPVELANALNRELQTRGVPPAQATAGFPGQQASIQIYPQEGIAVLTVPMDGFSGRIDLLSEIRGVLTTKVLATNETIYSVAQLRDSMTAASPGTYQTNFTLRPGSYVCNLVVTEQATGQMYGETINFTMR